MIRLKISRQIFWQSIHSQNVDTKVDRAGNAYFAQRKSNSLAKRQHKDSLAHLREPVTNMKPKVEHSYDLARNLSWKVNRTIQFLVCLITLCEALDLLCPVTVNITNNSNEFYCKKQSLCRGLHSDQFIHRHKNIAKQFGSD